MGEVVVEDGERVVDDRAVARPDRLDLVRLGEGVQPVQRVEVGPELPVRVSHDRRTAPEDGVAGQHRALGGEDERQ